MVTAVRDALSEFIRNEENSPQLAVAKNLAQSADAFGHSQSSRKREIDSFCERHSIIEPGVLVSAPLGRSLPIYRTFPKGQVIELRSLPTTERDCRLFTMQPSKNRRAIPRFSSSFTTTCT